MMLKKIPVIVLIMLLISSFGKEDSTASATVVSYPLPSCYNVSNLATMTAEGQNIPIIDFMPTYDYAHFSFSGKITITITVNETITSYSVSPLSKNITGKVNGNKLSFSIDKPEYLIVKINELQEIVIAADELRLIYRLPLEQAYLM